jgi:selenium metabolism protein YedF
MELHCEGEPCPQPVLRCKEILTTHQPASLTVFVDNDAARDNVSRFLSSQGMDVAPAQREGNLWRIQATRHGASEESMPAACPCNETRHVVFIATDHIGHGDDGLGHKLMGNFLATLPEMGSALWRLVLVNAGVKLTTADSFAIDALKRLEERGVEILVCGTCLEFFGLLSSKAVGQTTNMLDVVTTLQVADKVISLG